MAGEEVNAIDETTRLVIATAMRRMFESEWLDITCIDRCLKLARMHPPTRAHELLRALHCVKYSDMPRELAERLPGLISECFRGMPIGALVAAVEPATVQHPVARVMGLL